MKLKRTYLVFLLITLLYLAFSFSTYKDYGITADEERNYNTGGKMMQSLLSFGEGETDQALPFDKHNRLYPGILSLINSKGYYEQFHLLNLLFGYLIFAALYFLIFLEFGRTSFAVLSLFSLFLLPRFMGHLAANPKDMPFAVFYFLSVVGIYLFFRHKKLISTKYYIFVGILGILFGISQSLRIVGLSLYLIYFLYGLYIKYPLTRLFKETIMLFTIAFLFMLVSWPGFRDNPVKNFSALLTNAQSFEVWDNTILLNGEFLLKDSRPQAYLPIWLFITLPLYVLLFLPLSLSLLNRNKLLTLAWIAIFTNIALYFALKPVVYNGLRHFLYLLPLLLLVVLIYIFTSFKKGGVHKVSFVLMLLNFVFLFISIIKLHPYEYIYFNEVVGGVLGAKSNYELDYWGASYTEASKWLREQPYSKVYACNVSYAMLYHSHGKFEMVNSSKGADYIVCDYENSIERNIVGKPVFSVIRENVELLNIFPTGEL